MKVNISLAQIEVLSGKYKDNFYKVLNIIENLPEKERHFLLLPELWISGYSFNKFEEIFDFFIKNIDELTLLAKKKSVNIIGSVPWKENGKFFNRSILIDLYGNYTYKYDKIHLFKPLNEHKYFFHGNSFNVIKITDLKIGFMICYDIRFPELARELMLEGAEILFVYAQWPLERIEQWLIINKVRAIENQLFVVACNRVGTSDEITFGGNSVIISPGGNVVKLLNEKDEIVETVEIYTEDIEKSKKLFNIKEDVRLFK